MKFFIIIFFIILILIHKISEYKENKIYLDKNNDLDILAQEFIAKINIDRKLLKAYLEPGHIIEISNGGDNVFYSMV